MNIRLEIFISYYRNEHHVNSLFLNSYSLSPATNNLIAMRKIRTDRTAFHADAVDPLLPQDRYCVAGPDQEENRFRLNKEHLTAPTEK